MDSFAQVEFGWGLLLLAGLMWCCWRARAFVLADADAATLDALACDIAPGFFNGKVVWIVGASSGSECTWRNACQHQHNYACLSQLDLILRCKWRRGERESCSLAGGCGVWRRLRRSVVN